MANILKVAMVHAIIGLLERDWSYRRIARELGVHRETVARYDRLRQTAHPKPANPTPGSSSGENSKPANPTAGSDVTDHPKPANVTLGSGTLPLSDRWSGPPSLCEPFKDIIKQKLDQGLSAQRIWQDLVGEHGFDGSYSSVKRFVRRLGASTPLPFRRLECEPGQEAQVDFGSGAWIVEDGKKRRAHVLRIVLSHSRKGYSEAVVKQDTENFIRVLENAFHVFGGVPQTLVIDNLKAAVTRADWFDPELNPRIVEFARHYGFVFLPTKPYTPRHKGKIESGIKYVKNNALKCPERAPVHQPGRAQPVLDSLGASGGRHPHPRHHSPAGRQTLPGGGTTGVVATGRRTVPLLSRRAAHGQPRRPYRSGQGLLLGASGVSGTAGVGSLGQPGGAGLQ